MLGVAVLAVPECRAMPSALLSFKDFGHRRPLDQILAIFANCCTVVLRISMEDRYIYIYGKHAVSMALTHRPDVVKVLYLRDDVRDSFPGEQKSRASQLQVWQGKKLPAPIEADAVHQGVIAKIDRAALVVPYETWLQNLEVTNDTCVAVLGEMHDPHNVGAIIRSAAGFGVSAVLLPKHRQVGVTGTVAKVSVGMAFTLPIVEVGNVNRALEDLKQRGCFTYGLAGEGGTLLSQEHFSKPTVFVFGNEAEGLREKTREHCDILLRIPMHPRCESFNASVSAAVAFYAWSAQHPNATKQG